MSVQVPVDDEVVLSLSRMNRVLSLDEHAGNLICEAGCVLETLQEYFRVRFQSQGLVNIRRELEYVQSRRLLAVVKPFQIKVR